jgi:hypothetical protein
MCSCPRSFRASCRARVQPIYFAVDLYWPRGVQQHSTSTRVPPCYNSGLGIMNCTKREVNNNYILTEIEFICTKSQRFVEGKIAGLKLSSEMLIFVQIFGVDPLYMWLLSSRGSVVGTATGYGLDDRGITVRVPVGSRIFTSSHRPDRFWGSIQPTIQLLS